VQYLLPIKAGPNDDLQELARYVADLRTRLPVIVVDGSDPDTFRRNQGLFAGVTHVAPRPDLQCANGKVAGVLTGFTLAASDKVVIADDDVRYEPAELARLEQLLEDADVVIPQNYYAPLPWPARWDTARMLVNRALPSGDYPGTLGVRLSERMRHLGYDGNVLFENLELIRSVIADGGRPMVARDLYVRRLPPTAKHFAGQRVRQAYDSLAQPGRLAVELSLLPLALTGAGRGRVLVGLTAGSILTAEVGRRRAGGASYFPLSASWLAPAWFAERAVCAWLAVARRVAFGGTPYAGRRISRAATSVSALRRARARSCGSRRRTA
jgi:hypothetical protein